MAKNKIIIVISLILITALLSFNPVLGFYYYNSGQQALTKKDYQSASKKFQNAVKRCPDNLTYRYYYAESLAYIFKLEEAQKEFLEITKIAPSSNAAKLARGEFKKIQDYFEEKERYRASLISSFARQQDNYINGITNNGKIMHWNLKKMPLKIFIDSNNVQSGYVVAINKAIADWIGNLDSLITYKNTPSPDNADIKISFTGDLGTYKGNEGSMEASAGVTSSKIEGKMLKAINIMISTTSPGKEPMSEAQIYIVALHEFGHALGIGAHSYYKGDIMYPIVSDKSLNAGLSSRDINTVKLLYRLDADISNFSPEDINNRSSDVNSVVLGNKNYRYNNELLEAKNYINVAPNSPNSWAKLGEAYHNLKQYPDAVSCFNRALEIDPNYDAARERLAFTYIDMNDINRAIKEFNGLISKNPGNSAYSGNLALLYIKNNRHDDAKKVINALESSNPAVKDDENIRNIKLALTNKNIKLVITQE